MRPTDTAADRNVSEKVVDVVKEKGGMSAHDVVTTISRNESVSEKQVQKVVRSLLNRGELVVGSKLNLFVSEQ